MNDRVETEHLKIALFRSCVSAIDFEITKIQNSVLGLNTESHRDPMPPFYRRPRPFMQQACRTAQHPGRDILTVLATWSLSFLTSLPFLPCVPRRDGPHLLAAAPCSVPWWFWDL